MIHEHEGTVFFSEVDQGGVVYFANYLKILDNARTTFFNEIGFGFTVQARDRKMFAVVSLNIEYKRSLLLDESYRVRTRIGKVGKTSIELNQEIIRNDEVVTRANMVIAYLDFNQGQKPIRIPESLKEKLLEP